MLAEKNGLGASCEEVEFTEALESVGDLLAAEDCNCWGFSLDSAGWLGWVTTAAAAEEEEKEGGVGRAWAAAVPAEAALRCCLASLETKERYSSE